jgi:hypothetical protein
MERSADILAELEGISPLIAQLPRVNPYQVPADYFLSLADQCMENIRVEQVLSQSAGNTYTVPENYFNGLADSILAKLHLASGEHNDSRKELETIAPLLASSSPVNPYTVPANYFEQADFAEAATRYKKHAVVFNMRNARKWTQFAAAAIMTGVLVMGAFLFTDNNGNIKNENYDSFDVSSELNKVSVDDLAEFLNNPSTFIAAPAATPMASEDELADIKSNIRQFSDEELNQYVKENAEPYELRVSEKDN